MAPPSLGRGFPKIVPRSDHWEKTVDEALIWTFMVIIDTVFSLACNWQIDNQPNRLLHLPILIMVLMIVVRSTYSPESFVLISYLLSYWEKWNINWLIKLYTLCTILCLNIALITTSSVDRSLRCYRVLHTSSLCNFDQDWRRHLVVLESQGCFCFDNGNVRRMGMSQVCVPLRLCRWLRMSLWRVNSEGTDAHKLPLKGTYLIKRFLHNVS